MGRCSKSGALPPVDAARMRASAWAPSTSRAICWCAFYAGDDLRLQHTGGYRRQYGATVMLEWPTPHLTVVWTSSGVMAPVCGGVA